MMAIYPGRIPQRERVLEAYELHSDGFSLRKIADRIGGNYSAIRCWLQDPGKFDPYIDEVAIERAMKCDTSVIPRLSVFEYEESARRLMQMRQDFPDRYTDYTNQMYALMGKVAWRKVTNAMKRADQRARSTAA